MEGRQFEWAVVENVVSDAATEQCLKDPENWNLLHSDFVEDMVDFTDAHVDWILQRFVVFLTDMPSGFGQCFECHIEGRFTADTYAYRLEFFDEEEHLTSLHHLRLGYYAVALREVPPHLLVSCNLEIYSNAWKAVFTTLAGREFLCVEEVLPQQGVLCVSYLLEICREAAKREGLLRSRNQEARLLFNGSATELPEQAILWSRGVPFP